MKFCDNCGTQLSDDALFYEECGTKQDNVPISSKDESQKQEEVTLKNDNETHTGETVSCPETRVSESETSIEEKNEKLSEICTPAKRELKSNLLIFLLILLSPVIWSVILFTFLDFGIIWTILNYGGQVFALRLLWKKNSWNKNLKIFITFLYVVLNFFVF